ncbi:MAG: hypothetical protein L3J20_12625 [Flavobacteriaceae bacterium]|nr:hypothetical protein [Flavobacteriaceae bacterium]
MNNINKVLTFITIFLIILVIFSVEYLRPKFPHSLFLGVFPNFVGAFVLYNIIFSFFFEKSINVKNIVNVRFRLILLGVFIFLFFTFEEFFPFFTASKTLDIYDILASALGVLFAYLIFEQVIKLKND